MHWTTRSPPVSNSFEGKKTTQTQLINGRDWGRLAGIEQGRGSTTSKQITTQYGIQIEELHDVSDKLNLSVWMFFLDQTQLWLRWRSEGKQKKQPIFATSCLFTRKETWTDLLSLSSNHPEKYLQLKLKRYLLLSCWKSKYIIKSV